MPRKVEDDYTTGPPIRRFALAPTLLTAPDGRPVIRTAHRDLRPGEVNFILR